MAALQQTVNDLASWHSYIFGLTLEPSPRASTSLMSTTAAEEVRGGGPLLEELDEAGQDDELDTELSGSESGKDCEEAPAPAAQKFISIRVLNNRNVGLGIFAHTAYNVVGIREDAKEFHATRRYTDILTLRSALLRRCPELRLDLPELPEKKVIGKLRPAFIERRRAGLEQFLQSVISLQVKHPVLASYLERFFTLS
eukprot:m.106386 g.106386  ORF g.106386 m.106386 type:complete len:198 (-) comp9177_c0_seq5:139-732(-)